MSTGLQTLFTSLDECTSEVQGTVKGMYDVLGALSLP